MLGLGAESRYNPPPAATRRSEASLKNKHLASFIRVNMRLLSNAGGIGAPQAEQNVISD
jgi:hypothetical protein